VIKKNRTLSFKLRESTLEELRTLADQRDESVSSIVRAAIKSYLGERVRS